MIPNHSPWIKQLNRTRPVVRLSASVSADVAIVGGGIAGIVTAFFTLRDTAKSIVLVEADKVAHGATGHNAGQITSYFERPLTELVEEFGVELAIDGQRSVESGWLLLDEIVAEANLQTPLYRFIGYAGLSTIEQILRHLKDNAYRAQGGLPNEDIVVSETIIRDQQIPIAYRDLYTVVSSKDVLELLETNNTEYIAALAYPKGCMNSALFSEELVRYLLKTYGNRFSLYEESSVTTVRLKKSGGTLDVLGHLVAAEKIVLCTNGFENFTILNEDGPEINTKFHQAVAGRIGYMTGYVAPRSRPPTAISFFPKGDLRSGDPTGESYFYLTRRPHEHEGSAAYNLVCVGGPEKVLPNGAGYSRADSCSEEVRNTVDDFLRSNYNKHPAGETEYAFCWHGLMGYTPNGIRRVGSEPCNPVLLYNLGCNGVGILPSIFGGKRISRLLNNVQVKPSIFDPLDQRSPFCERE